MTEDKDPKKDPESKEESTESTSEEISETKEDSSTASSDAPDEETSDAGESEDSKEDSKAEEDSTNEEAESGDSEEASSEGASEETVGKTEETGDSEEESSEEASAEETEPTQETESTEEASAEEALLDDSEADEDDTEASEAESSEDPEKALDEALAIFDNQKEVEAEEYIPWDSPDPVIPPLWRPAAPLLLLLMCGLIMYVFYDDFMYYFQPKKAIELGSTGAGCEDSFYKKLKHNRYVRLKNAIVQPGMTTQARMQFKKRNYIVILGCDLFIAVTKENYKKMTGPGGSIATRNALETRGRLLQVQRTSTLDTLKNYYGHYGAIKFSERTYLIMDDTKPSSYWWMLILFGFLGGCCLYNIYRFFISVWRNWLTRSDADDPQRIAIS